MSFDVVLSDLKTIYPANEDLPYAERNHLTEDDIRKWCALIGQSRAVLFDRIATWLALGFNNSELSFGFCDAVVNDIFGVITSSDEPTPKHFWEIYLAFDAGEYYHNRDEDPVPTYTRPAIAAIIAKLS